METVLLVAIAVVACVAALWWRRRPRGRMVECCACGRSLPVSRAVILHGSISREREGFSTTVAEYHKGCAPKEER